MTETPTFKTVMRGYDVTEVDRAIADFAKKLAQAEATISENAAELTRLQSSSNRLHQDIEEYRSKAAVLEDELHNSSPTFEDLGKRVGQILSLAQAESDEMLTNARAEAETLTNETAAAANQISRGLLD